MLARLKRWLLPRRVSAEPETSEFRERMKDARLYGIEQSKASLRAMRRPPDSRDFADVMAAPPPWRPKGGDQ